MPVDPIHQPVAEDVVHADDQPVAPRIDLPPPKRHKQTAAWERAMRRECAELAAVLATDAGQAVILRILDDCHIYHAGPLPPEDQGKRMLGVALIHRISALGGDAYPKLLIAHAARQARLRAEDASYDQLP